MVLVVIALLGTSLAGCEKHVREVRGGNTRVVAVTPAR
jgi:hypothetical protein